MSETPGADTLEPTPGQRLIEGAREALAIARGEIPAARITINGHAYVPEAEAASLRAEKEELRRERDEARAALWDAGKAIEDARGLGPLQAELDDCLREERPALEKEYRQITARVEQTLIRIASLTKEPDNAE